MKLLEKILMPVNFKSKYKSQIDLGINIAEQFKTYIDFSAFQISRPWMLQAWLGNTIGYDSVDFGINLY